MHGSICCIVQRFVEDRFDEAFWNQILERANHPGLSLSPIKMYDDDVVVALLSATCEIVGVGLDDLLLEIGKFAGPELISFAGAMLHPEWQTFELLKNVEALIHRTIRMLNSDARPPNVRVFSLSTDRLQVVYSSRRGLCSFAQGIMEGVTDHFHEQIEIRQVTCMKKGEPFCTFDVERLLEIDCDSDFVPGTSGRSSPTSSSPRTPNETIVMLTDGDSEAKPLELGTRLSSNKSFAKAKSTSLPKRIDRYEILDVLGQGGMGIVYKANDTSLNRVVALKTLPGPSLKDEITHLFLEEARAMARLSHENVVRIYDAGTWRRRPYFVMEFMTGKTLSERISQGVIPVIDGLKLLRQLLSGMDAMHRIGLVHRDIKPSNIMISLDLRRCCLLDFGLAHIASKRPDSAQSVSGTPGYVAPERLRGIPADYRSDFFSLGCVAFQMFRGIPAFPQSSIRGLIEAMDAGAANDGDWGELDDGTRNLIEQLLVSDPGERLADRDTVDSILLDLIRARELSEQDPSSSVD